MVDSVDPQTRSRIMARIGAKDTRPELALRRVLHGRGLRYRVHVAELPGTPDLAFRQFQAVCFVHGCFWHRHAGCNRATHPSTRREYWQAKFTANVERDRIVREKLLHGGWRVAVVWECTLGGERTERTAQMFERWLRGIEREFETSLDAPSK